MTNLLDAELDADEAEMEATDDDIKAVIEGMHRVAFGTTKTPTPGDE